MPTYRVTGTETVVYEVTVTAANEQEARRLAETRHEGGSDTEMDNGAYEVTSIEEVASRRVAAN